MKKEIDAFMDRAVMALDDTEFLYPEGRTLALANRAYYAIFYCIGALLLTEGVTTKKHSGAQSKFNELFVKTGRFDVASSKLIARSFGARQSADYDMDTTITDEQARQLIDDARQFYAMTQAYFGQHPVD